MAPTKKQIEFAYFMSERQWRVLQALSDFSFYLSASERADPELYALIRSGLARCHPSVPTPNLFSWSATPVGRTMLRRRTEGRLWPQARPKQTA